MVEIYNEDLRDLLAPLAGKQKKAQLLQIKVGTNPMSAVTVGCMHMHKARRVSEIRVLGLYIESAGTS